MAITLNEGLTEVLMKYHILKEGKENNDTSDEYKKKKEEYIKFMEKFKKSSNNFVSQEYKVKSNNLGRMGWVPYVSIILNENSSHKEDYYVVYLFNSEGDGVYLTVSLGAKQLKNRPEYSNYTNEDLNRIITLKNYFKEYLINNWDESLQLNFNDLDNNLDLVDDEKDTKNTAKAFEYSTLFSKFYHFNNQGDLPNEEELEADLNDFLDIFKFAKNFDDNFVQFKNEVLNEDLHLSGEVGSDNEEICEYWIFSPGGQASNWDEQYDKEIIAMDKPVGDLKEFNQKEEIVLSLQQHFNNQKDYSKVAGTLLDFANTLKPGDIIFARDGVKKIIGQGVVESDYIYDDTQEYKHIRKVKWLEKGVWDYENEGKQFSQDTLVNITNQSEKLEIIKKYFKDNPCKYTKKEFLEEAFITENDYDAMAYLLKKYKNLILQGPPGVGKTFLAKRLADSLIGRRYSGRVEMVQFHQSYSYEDFFMGYKPAKKGFKCVNGPFYKFCKKAEENPSKNYYFIIDEINRGDLSKIFGELFMLIEDDKRGVNYKTKLLYKDEYFSVPENVYIIGLMNTADRSIAMVDYALRRRFAFFDLKPGFDSENFKEYQAEIGNKSFNEVIEQIKSLNKTIVKDDILNEGFCIGHSYFCNLDESEDLNKDLSFIIDYKILPLLREYWFDEKDNDEIRKLKELSKDLKTKSER